MTRSHSANDAGSYRPTGYRLPRFVDTINKRSRYASEMQAASVNFLLVGYRKLDLTRYHVSRFLSKRKNYQRYWFTQKFRISLDKPSEMEIIGYQIFHPRGMDLSTFCTQKSFPPCVFDQHFSTHTRKSMPDTRSRAHPRETCLSLTFCESWRISFIC